MGRHLSKENKKIRIDRILELRDNYDLEFKIIAERMGIPKSQCVQLYYDEKDRRRKGEREGLKK